jgi:hypothetical protein
MDRRAALITAVDWQALSAIATAIAALGTTVAVIIAALA